MIEAVIFDYGRTLYDPVAGRLFPEADKVLNNLVNRQIRLGLVTIAVDTQLRRQELTRFGIEELFSSIDVVDLRKRKDFTVTLEALKTNPQQCVVIGDSLKREITEGNRIGAVTIWTRQRLFSSRQPRNDLERPKAVIDSLGELIPKIDELNS